MKRRTFTPLPAPPHIISRVHELSDEDNQNPALNFCDRNGNAIDNASLSNPNISVHDSDIAGVNEISVNNSGVDQLVNEYPNYETVGV